MTVPRPAYGPRWLLLVSLALNVALLAGIAWEYFDHDGPRHPRGHALHMATMTHPMPNPMRLRGSLPEDRRGIVDAVLDEHRARIRDSVRGVFQARARVHALMAADTIDRPALDRAFAELRERDAEAARTVQAMLTELAIRLTPEERRALARSIQHGPRHPRH